MLDCLSASNQGSLQSLTPSGSRDQRGTQRSAERVTRTRGVEQTLVGAAGCGYWQR